MSILGLSIELRERTNDEFYVVTHCSKADAALIFSAETQTRISSIYSFFLTIHLVWNLHPRFPLLLCFVLFPWNNGTYSTFSNICFFYSSQNDRISEMYVDNTF